MDSGMATVDAERAHWGSAERSGEGCLASHCCSFVRPCMPRALFALSNGTQLTCNGNYLSEQFSACSCQPQFPVCKEIKRSC
jgi:hypothetical protein